MHTGIKPYLCECCTLTFSCIGNLIKHRKIRPTTCGLPIYTNKKICKRAGVKCRGKSKVVVSSVKELAEVKIEPEDEEPVEFHDNSQQCVTLVSQSSQDAQLEDYAKKEMDVFDFIGIEIRNIEEQEKELQMKSEATAGIKIQEFLVDDNNSDNFYMDENDVIEDETVETEAIVIEKIETLPMPERDEDEELSQYIDSVSGASFHCRLCPKIYQKKNITVKHLRTEHQIHISNYIYEDSNRYRKPQKDANWKCRFCPKRYTSKRLAERHEKVHGSDGELRWKCSCCALYFQTVEQRDDHQHSTHQDRLMCKFDNCSKKFDHPEKLASHVKYSHSAKKGFVSKYVFVCQLCGKRKRRKA